MEYLKQKRYYTKKCGSFFRHIPPFSKIAMPLAGNFGGVPACRQAGLRAKKYKGIFWDKDKERIACAILAGGQNKRMGEHKAFLTYHGRKFIDIIGDNMKAFFDEVFIVSNDKALFRGMPDAVFEDIIPGKGPLGALHAALTVTKKEYIFCVACDMPETYDSVIAKIICASKKHDFDCFVPQGKFGLEPLFAIYRKSMRGLIEKEIAAGQLCISKVLEKCRTFYIDMAKHENELVNINTPQEYQGLLHTTVPDYTD